MEERTNTTVQASGKEDVRRFYEEYASSWDDRFGDSRSTQHFLRKRLLMLRRLARFAAGDRVLEVGCGTAMHLIWCAGDFAEGTGMDFSPGMLDVAREKAKSSGITNLRFVVDDAEQLKTVEDGSIDVIFFVGLLEHLLDPQSFLTSALRVLKDGGQLVGFTPNAISPWYSSVGKLFRKSTRHLSTDALYGAKQLGDMLTATGFASVDLVYWGFVPAGIPDLLFYPLFLAEKVLERTWFKRWAGGLAFAAMRRQAH